MASSPPQTPVKIGTAVNFLTAGMGGCMGWVLVHPANLVAVRMNLASSSSSSSGAPPLSFLRYLQATVKEHGVLSLYTGLSAGLTRQVFYATSRFGIFEEMRDWLAQYSQPNIASRMATGVLSGGIAAFVSCPAEVTLVRISNDATMPLESRRNYKGIVDAFTRIYKEEGIKTFFSGSGPFVNRAMLVGAVQVGTYDQFKEIYRAMGVVSELQNVFYSAMTSGFIYSVITMPLETAKNRMAFQKADAITGVKPYRTALQTMQLISSKEGAMKLFKGFSPYYLRCGGHTVAMFISVEWLRKIYRTYA